MARSFRNLFFVLCMISIDAESSAACLTLSANSSADTHLNSSDSINETHVNVNCSEECTSVCTYVPGEYIPDDEDNILVVSLGKEYHPGEYSVDEKDTVTIPCCSKKNENGFFSFDANQKILTLVGSILSMCCLVATIIVYIVLKDLRTLPGKLMINLAIALFFAQLILVVSVYIDKIQDIVLCNISAVLEHYLWFAVLLWMNSFCFAMFKGFYNSHLATKDYRAVSRPLLKYMIFAWGTPSIIVVICCVLAFGTDLDISYGSPFSCWLAPDDVATYVFVIPATILILVNFGFIIFTIIHIYKAKRTVAKFIVKKKERNIILITIKLSFVMGGTWIFSFLDVFLDNTVIGYFSIIFMAMQGIFLFLAFVCNKRVFRQGKSVIRQSVRSIKASNIITNISNSRKLSSSTNVSSLSKQ